MQAIVLAGGLGTRLRSVTKDIPKPMAPIGDKPFLAFVLEYLEKQGVREVILSVSYKYKIIQDYFKNRFCGMNIIYNIEEELLGTGGAIKDSLRLIGNDAYVLNGDTFFDINLKELSLEEGKMCIALKKMKNFDRYGSVNIDSKGFVVSFEEKVYKTEGFISGGIYYIKKDIFNNFSLKDKFSFEKFLQENLALLNIKAKVFSNYFIDIGIPSDYTSFVEKHREMGAIQG